MDSFSHVVSQIIHANIYTKITLKAMQSSSRLKVNYSRYKTLRPFWVMYARWKIFCIEMTTNYGEIFEHL